MQTRRKCGKNSTAKEKNKKEEKGGKEEGQKGKRKEDRCNRRMRRK